ncbi:MAG TPA: GNAT family N-acetyltransferase [Ktedonobacteraceae bacterium]|nr:GNAT family N-acetyltransferase [Ktedonobacteraceae bacterium]
MKNIQLQTWNPTQSIDPLLELWQAALGTIWPITAEGLLSTILESGYQEGDCVVAIRDERIAGVVVINQQKGDQTKRGFIMCLLVRPDQQRQGIGTLLLREAIERLKQREAKTIYLGGGPDAYFWGGVPTNLPQAVAFFQAHGWRLENKQDTIDVDLTMDLQGYTTPNWVWERVRNASVSIELARPQERDEILRFERQHFPGWGNAVENAFRLGRLVVVARTPQGEVAGTCIAYLPGLGYNCLWSELLGSKTGCLGEVGVARRFRGQGVGMALSAKATETFIESGNKTGYVRWLSLISWYGKLGYTTWRSYYTEQRSIEECTISLD